MNRFSSLPKRPRFSLTWRVIALSSLLLVTLVALFIWLGHQQLTRQFDNSRMAHHERQQREIRFAMQRSADNLRQLAGLTAAALPLGSALRQGDASAVEDTLREQWPSLQLEAGVDEVLVFDPEGRLVGHSGGTQPSIELPVQGWIDDVLIREVPITTLRCSIGCQQYAAVPILVSGNSIGMVVLSRSLADVTREAREVSGSDIALMVTGFSNATTLDTRRRLPAWDGHLVALTNREATLPLLEEASRKAPIFALADRPLRLTYAGRYVELSAVYMEDDADWRSTGYFLLISDVTAQNVAIQRATQTLLALGIIGWLAAELLLLAILLGPMARLRRVASLLPALAHGEFTNVRDKLPSRPPRHSNEIDVLENSTRTLANQLQRLESSVTENSTQLAERVEELAHEKDFVNSLLDTAQIFIVVHGPEGRIKRVNDYTRQRLGLTDDALIDRYFDDVFAQAAQVSLPSQTPRAPHVSSPPTLQQEEKTLQTADKQYCTVAWYHSMLPGSPCDTALRISVGLDISERKAAEERLTWLAERDSLTELFNRRYFQNALQSALLDNSEGAIVLLDLDQFKEINELSGHHVGDHLLREVAESLFLHLGQRSIVARLGGDEFALLLEGITGDQAINIAEYIHQLLSAISFQSGGRKHHISASMGIALFPMHGSTSADLLASADMAMYKAKESTHQRWYLLSQIENAKDELQDRVYWVEQLHHALEHNDFELMVQPIVRLEDLDIKHYEVLLRIRRPDGQLVAPQHFIPIAEQSGLIVALDRWVIRHSLRALSSMQDRGISLAVNLSGQSLHDLELKRYLTDELRTSGADPHHLILEVTETAAITDFSTARNVLQTVRDLGCRTALDDFGIGFSSFHYLGQLPVDYIKIDGSFIRSLLINPDSHTIVKAVADIAKGFGKQTIAEFVDQDALLPILQEYGITYGQGFYFGKPRSLAQLVAG